MVEYATTETPAGLSRLERRLFDFMKDGRSYTRDRLRLAVGWDEYHCISALTTLMMRLRPKLHRAGFDIMCQRNMKEPYGFRFMYRMVKLVGPPEVCREDPGWGKVMSDGSPRVKTERPTTTTSQT